MTWQTALARVRFPLLALAIVVLLLGDRAGIPGPGRLGIFAVLYIVAVRAGTVRRPPATVQPPVTGRWRALNSPGSRVPSHGIQAYGQTHAIDLVHEPADGTRPGPGFWPPTRPATAFPGFGQPVVAATTGVVVRARDRARDHRSRTSWPGLLYLVVEGIVRELTGPDRVLGNQVIVDHGDGTWAAYAHLRQGSLRVTRGQQVEPGDHIADCGNSGNSSEPHLHFQVMDHPNVLVAAGLPFRFDRRHTGGASSELPANGEIIDIVATGATSVQDGTAAAGQDREA